AWWSEASATWSEDFVYEKDERITADLRKTLPAFLYAKEKPLDLRDDEHEYGAYLFPFFLNRIKKFDAGIVRKAWERIANQSALEALDEVLPGHFAAIWPEFV